VLVTRVPDVMNPAGHLRGSGFSHRRRRDPNGIKSWETNDTAALVSHAPVLEEDEIADVR
jgi:hypothetical protein